MNTMSYSIGSTSVNKYQISTSSRVVDISYTMNNGYSGPITNPSISGVGSVGAAINNRAFEIPINGYGDLTVTPGGISKISYDIVSGPLVNGLNSMTFTPNSYVINHTHNISVSISHTLNAG